MSGGYPALVTDDSALDRIDDDVPLFFDRTGRPITARVWSELYSTRSYQCLRRDIVGDSAIITVWSGMDDSCGDADQPQIFGTIREVRGQLLPESELTAATEAEALANHDAMLEELRDAMRLLGG